MAIVAEHGSEYLQLFALAQGVLLITSMMITLIERMIIDHGGTLTKVLIRSHWCLRL